MKTVWVDVITGKRRERVTVRGEFCFDDDAWPNLGSKLLQAVLSELQANWGPGVGVVVRRKRRDSYHFAWTIRREKGPEFSHRIVSQCVVEILRCHGGKSVKRAKWFRR